MHLSHFTAGWPSELEKIVEELMQHKRGQDWETYGSPYDKYIACERYADGKQTGPFQITLKCTYSTQTADTFSLMYISIMSCTQTN